MTQSHLAELTTFCKEQGGERSVPRSRRPTAKSSTFDEAVVVQFRESAETAITIGFDRETGQSLHEFLLEREGRP